MLILSEDAEIDDLGLQGLLLRQSFESLVERQEIDVAARSLLGLRERECNPPETSSPFDRPASLGMVDEDESHRPGGSRAQVGLVPPGRGSVTGEAKIHLVHEGGRLEGVIPALGSE